VLKVSASAIANIERGRREELVHCSLAAGSVMWPFWFTSGDFQ